MVTFKGFLVCPLKVQYTDHRLKFFQHFISTSKILFMEKLSHSLPRGTALSVILDFLQHRCFLVGILMTQSRSLLEVTTLALQMIAWPRQCMLSSTSLGHIHKISFFSVTCKVWSLIAIMVFIWHLLPTGTYDRKKVMCLIDPQALAIPLHE